MAKGVIETLDRSGTDSLKYDEASDRFGAKIRYPLWVADMDFAVSTAISQAITQRANHPIYGYTSYPEAFFEAIMRWYRVRHGLEIKKEWIIPMPGVVFSLFTAVRAFSDPKSQVIIQPPIYPPFLSALTKQERIPLRNTLIREAQTWRINWRQLKAQSKSASLMLLCSPHNPTGRCWDEDELKKLLAIASQEDIIIVSDEIWSDIVYEKTFVSLLAFERYHERIAVLHAPSKTFNIAGLNTSFAIIPSDSLRRRFEAQMRRCAASDPGPFGIQALIAAYNESDRWYEALMERLYANRDHIIRRLRGIGVEVLPPEATFLAWLDFRSFGLTHEKLKERLYRHALVALNEGTMFDRECKGFMRLNFATDLKQLDAAIDRIEAVL